MTPEDFQQQDIRIIASIVGVDTVIVAPVALPSGCPEFNDGLCPYW
jgi:hypothetical protein